MKNVNVSIKAVKVNNEVRHLFVETLADGREVVYVGCGNAAMIVSLEEATPVELHAAYCVEAVDWTVDNLCRALARRAGVIPSSTTTVTKAEDCDDEDTLEVIHRSFERACNALMQMEDEAFVRMVDYAKTHGNKFPKNIFEIANVVNADDVYCTVIADASKNSYLDIANIISYIVCERIPVAKRAAFWKFIKA